MSTSLLNSDRIPHALLLSGGTTENALEIAAMANCLSDTRRPCGTCSSCVKLRESNHPDVIVFNCEGAKVEQIRELCSDSLVRPNEGRHKVYILKDAHELSAICQNALLKALEEPPKSVVFILTAERADNLLPTVRSRLFRQNRGIAQVAEVGETAVKILNAYDSRNELNLLLSMLSCDKMNRDDFSVLISELRQGLLERRAVAAVEKLGELQLTLERNVGIGHVCGAIVATLANSF